MNELHDRVDNKIQALTAGVFNSNQHPRGRGGTFITVGGTVQVTNPAGAPVSEGKVTGISLAGQITVQNTQTGQSTQVPPTQIAQAPMRQATIPRQDAPAQMTQPGTNGTFTLTKSGALPPTNKNIIRSPGGMPVDPYQAAAQAVRDAQAGKRPLGTGNPRALYAYTRAYQRQQALQAKQAAAAKLRAAKLKAAAVKKATKKKAAAAKKATKTTAPKYHPYKPISSSHGTTAGKVPLG